MSDGVEQIIKDLPPHFEEKTFLRKADVAGEHESLKRQAGEGLHQYITRFKTVENRVVAVGLTPQSDPEMRAFKFINSAMLTKETKNSVLTTAGHIWDLDRIFDAIKTLYPRTTTQSDDRANHRIVSGGKKPF